MVAEVQCDMLTRPVYESAFLVECVHIIYTRLRVQRSLRRVDLAVVGLLDAPLAAFSLPPKAIDPLLPFLDCPLVTGREEVPSLPESAAGLICRFARPSSHLFTRDAKRSEHSDSPRDVSAGDKLAIIRVLQLPPRLGCSR
jgi:hypothetical protein